MHHNDTSGAVAAFRLYARAFQALDAGAAAQHFHEPALLITPETTVALPTVAAIEQTYARLMADLPARGYARTEFSPLTERRLGDDLALVSGSAAWKNASGEDLMRFGMTYMLRRTGQTWRIVVAAIHAPDVDGDDLQQPRP
jgi:ketosteroid isomerase-like protein